MGTSLLGNTRDKLKSILREVDKLKGLEFPQAHSKEAITRIGLRLEKSLVLVERLSESDNKEIIARTCREAMHQIWLRLPHLGFFLRSTNVRNAFEMNGPLLRLARRLVKDDIKLILSSEWEFSPFIEGEIPGLDDFVLIGFPASESSNGLLLPLAGHELGHAVWKATKGKATFEPVLRVEMLALLRERFGTYAQFYPGISKDHLDDLTGYPSWKQSHMWSILQAEETFCDLVGLRVFGESFAHSFSYLLAPGTAPEKGRYPRLATRAENLVRGASAFGLTLEADFVDNFPELEEAGDAKSRFFYSLATDAFSRVVVELIKKADLAVREKGVETPAREKINAALHCFERVYPASEIGCLASILSAGWEARRNRDLWKAMPHIQARHDEILNELILKSIEVLEIERILKG